LFVCCLFGYFFLRLFLAQPTAGGAPAIEEYAPEDGYEGN
jgi:hypothetical protein